MENNELLLEKVRSFGILGYSVDKIIDLISPENVAQFKVDFETENTPIWNAYHKGLRTGQYNLDKELFDASTKLHDTKANESLKNRLQHNKIDDTIYQNFGL